LYIVTTAQMQAAEKTANDAGLSYDQMMENAGRAIARAIETEFQIVGAPVLILVGPGNNGGDGLVTARYLAQAGAVVTVYVWQPPHRQGRNFESDRNWQALENSTVQRLLSNNDPHWSELTRQLQVSTVIVDALLGTGVSRPIEGTLAALLQCTQEILATRRLIKEDLLIEPACPNLKSKIQNPKSPYVVAVDIPSGLNSDSGLADPYTLMADLTVTLAAVKMGHILRAGPELTGRLMVGDIQLKAAHYPREVTLEMVTATKVAAMLPPRPASAYKGTFGKAMVVAGSLNYTGAAILAGRAALRSGVGWVMMACPQTIYPILASCLVEATYLPLPDEHGSIASEAAPLLANHLERVTAMLMGPGLGQAESTIAFWHSFFSSPQPNLPPLILDADGLNILATTRLLEKSDFPTNCILTPHYGEMSRLMGLSLAEVQEQRLASVIDMAVKWKQIVLLKGAYTIVAAPDGRTMVLPFANPALAKAGSGDVLAGVITSLRAQGVPPFESAVAGAYLHGVVGELARQQLGAVSVTAAELINYLPLAIRLLPTDF